jgi:hypothetical protein
MSGFALHANEPLASRGGVLAKEAPPRDVEWFKDELVKRGVNGFEIICHDYREYFYAIPVHLLDAYLERRPRMLHRTALAEVLAADGK